MTSCNRSPCKLPPVLSIDEFKGNTDRENYQCIITDPVSRRILDILPSREKHHLTAYFKGFERSRTLLNKRYEFLCDEQKQQITIMLYASEKLNTAYWLKESFLKVLDCKDSNGARKQLSDWVMAASNSNIKRYADCAKTMVHWSVGILNSFDCTYTNGFTEGCNNKIKVLKKNVYGYRNFSRFRNRILHIFNHNKNEVA